MNVRNKPDHKAYEKIIGVFRKNRGGLSISDVSAHTGLSLNQVKELVPVAADEYSARLVVTESSEILYSFPHGFKSRYRGAGPALRRFFLAFAGFSKAALTVLFKAWIMIMLIGYFLLFMAIALASVFISVAASSNSKNSRGGGSRGGWNVSVGLFNTIFRLWFYSEMFGGRRYYGGLSGSGNTKKAGKNRPLHRAIFSFVFGEEDPNKDREILEKKAFISFLREKRGVVSLPELMALTGLVPQKAEEYISGLCVEFGGTPELTEEGTLVYRFDEILLSGEKTKTSQGLFGVPDMLKKKLRIFSLNPGGMNLWFIVINGINLLFGSYFLYNTVAKGEVLFKTLADGSIASSVRGMYGIVYYFLAQTGIAPLPVIQIFLGIIPLVFSLFFWAIPAIRSFMLKKENNRIRMDNFRSLGYGRIWEKPDEFRPTEFNPSCDDCRPSPLGDASIRIVKEMGTYSMPEVSLDGKQNELYSFRELLREKDALTKYREAIDPSAALPGKAIFDSGE